MRRGVPREVTPLHTRYLVYSVDGICFPFGGDFFASGIGRTIIYGPFSNTVRGLSLKECWLIRGGNLEEFSVTPQDVVVARMLSVPPLALQLYMAGLLVGMSSIYCFDHSRVGMVSQPSSL